MPKDTVVKIMLETDLYAGGASLVDTLQECIDALHEAIELAPLKAVHAIQSAEYFMESFQRQTLEEVMKGDENECGG